MEIFILSFAAFGLAALGMGAGLLLTGTAPKGTCATLGAGGLPSLDCAICRVRKAGCRRRSIAGGQAERP